MASTSKERYAWSNAEIVPVSSIWHVADPEGSFRSTEYVPAVGPGLDAIGRALAALNRF